MAKTFWQAVKSRRSIYGLEDQKTVSEERIEEIVSDALRHTPSAFNSQSTRIVLLFGEQSQKLWQLTLETLRQLTSKEQFAETEQKITGAFASGYGTVLFFEEQTVVDSLISSFPLYADRFPVWSQHTNAMHQFVIWTALEAEGLGASLQHYNPLIDSAVQAEWGVPASWKLVAQLPFGKAAAEPGEKQTAAIDARLQVFR
ncbi:MAG: nitroreductase family protein [Sporomusaceae bacterium]|nr:nitroreductase family protein [Sporomusaceae bacterium]